MLNIVRRSLFRLWADVITAIFIREIQRKFNDRFGVSWAVISPLIFTIGFAYVRGLRDGGETYGMPTFMFVLFGMVLVQLFLGTLTNVAGAIKRNKKLFGFRSVRPIAAMVAVALFELFTTVVVALMLSVVVYLLEIEVEMNKPFILFAVVLVAWSLGFAIGMLFALFSEQVGEISKLQAFITRPAFFLSGIFFSLNDIPSEYWYFLDWNPLLHCVELARYAAYGSYPVPGVSLFYTVQVGLLLIFIAMVAYHRLWRKSVG